MAQAKSGIKVGTWNAIFVPLAARVNAQKPKPNPKRIKINCLLNYNNANRRKFQTFPTNRLQPGPGQSLAMQNDKNKSRGKAEYYHYSIIFFSSFGRNISLPVLGIIQIQAMIQHINWEKLTLTGRLFSVEDGTVTLTFLLQCFACMILDICIYFAASIFSYRILVWTLFTPAERGFYCNDMSIREPLYPNTIPTLTLLAITLAGPFFIIVFADLLRRLKCHSRDFAQLVNHSTYVYLDYVIAFWLMTLGIDVIKCFTGRVRPNFVSMCNPKEIYEVCEANPSAFVPIAHCETGWKNARNSKLSFPSGHAAASVFCTLFLIFYLRGLQKRLPYLRLKIMFCIITLLFTLFSVWCCISRITDCWHFPSDVLGGVIYGSLMFYLLLHKYTTTNISELKRGNM